MGGTESLSESTETPTTQKSSLIVLPREEDPDSNMACFVTMLPITAAEPQTLVNVLNDALGADTFAVEVL